MAQGRARQTWFPASSSQLLVINDFKRDLCGSVGEVDDFAAAGIAFSRELRGSPCSKPVVWKSCCLSGVTPGDRQTKASRGEGAITLPRDSARAGQDALGCGASPHSRFIGREIGGQK